MPRKLPSLPALAVCLAALPALAFHTSAAESGAGNDNHADATLKLAGKLGYDGPSAKLLQQGNVETDSKDPAKARLYRGTSVAPVSDGRFNKQPKGTAIDLYNYAPAHFDSEAFAEGSRRLRETYKLIFRHLEQGHRTEALWLMGSSLHSIQDFFAHSNFVELGSADRGIDLFNLAQPPASLKCTPKAGASGLTSGYWPDDAKVTGKCHHIDLNKDGQNHRNHAKAFGRAVKESTAFLQRVEADIRKRYPADADKWIAFLKREGAKAPIRQGTTTVEHIRTAKLLAAAMAFDQPTRASKGRQLAKGADVQVLPEKKNKGSGGTYEWCKVQPRDGRGAAWVLCGFLPAEFRK